MYAFLKECANVNLRYGFAISPYLYVLWSMRFLLQKQRSWNFKVVSVLWSLAGAFVPNKEPVQDFAKNVSLAKTRTLVRMTALS